MIGSLTIPGLSDDDNKTLNLCLTQLDSVEWINGLRRRYFESRQRVQHLGISIPPQLQSFETVLGWPYKAVKSLATRVKLGGFAIPGADVADYGIQKIWAENRMGIEVHHAHMSALTYGASFVAVLAGGSGEPDVVIRALSPTATTALWDANRRRASAAVSVIAWDAGMPSEFILYLDDKVVTARRVDGEWSIEEASHTLGRCPVVVLAYDSSPEYPFGRSRITQGVMRITDEAIRTALRMEVSAEFYSSPQRYLLGANESAFTDGAGNTKSGWDAILGRMLAVGRDEDGEIPTVGQFSQMSMQPHADMLRLIGGKFSGETNIPVSALGITQDNPSSNEAMLTAYIDLDADAESAHEPFGAAWIDAMRMAVEIVSGSTDGLELLTAKWRDPATPTRASAADAVMKLVSSGVLPADSSVTLEQLGFDQTTIDRIQADRRRSGVSDLVSGIAGRLDAQTLAATTAARGAGTVQ